MQMVKLGGHGALLAGVLSLMGLTGCELVGPGVEDVVEGAQEPKKPRPGEIVEPKKPGKDDECPDFSTSDCCKLSELYAQYSEKLPGLSEPDRAAANHRMACMKPYLVNSCRFDSLPAARCAAPEKETSCPDFSTSDCCKLAELYQSYGEKLRSGSPDATTAEGLRERMVCMKPHLVDVCGFESLPVARCEAPAEEEPEDTLCDRLVASYAQALKAAGKGDEKALESLDSLYGTISVKCPDVDVPPPPVK
ncbi:MAG: hypothetical protein KA712_24520 [Myxococcales bacterium]|nr:hypothetical protein [Myxococcales bacterium]